uniref:Uncharacterized protein n=1 Tax=Trieres chinensis TaxID=1514140 RepID=A0A7S1Z761_TRICV|mmetsp:Transcript_18929/g.38377  ORF Transcript_18929/g.38377 Transcript_18929/m.38377 type:complete len:113 (+) Transcript_18929:597-935(+)
MEEQRPDGRFLVIGTYEDCVMLLRSRRQHYDAVVIGGQRMFRVEELPEATRNLWPNLAGAVPTPTPSLTPSDDRNVVEEEEEKKEDGTEKGAKGGRGGEKASSSPRKKKKSV